MMSFDKPKFQFPGGPTLSGAGGALLALMFFLPWFSACNLSFSGAELAFGKTLAVGAFSSPSGLDTYPWLGVLVLLGLLALGLALASFVVSADLFARLRPFSLLGVGGLAALLLLVVVVGFVRETAELNSSGLVQVNVEYGFLGAWLGTLLILAGAIWDLAQMLRPRETAWSTAYKPLQETYVPPSSGPAYAPPAPAYAPPGPAYVPPPPRPRLNRAVLRGTHGPLAGQVMEVSGDGITLGRSSENQVQVPDAQASRRHAVIRYAQGCYYLQDQHSSHGTRLNGQPIQASVLNDGDVITIGETSMVFQILE